ncbi:MAG TPA: glycosyltransferase family 4 protein, partial [Candidatus Marinimicrobia bacterium]|nr:glycosyltransferase family 4 protein [Candidatus Neomarinimicrobiota bacterium]
QMVGPGIEEKTLQLNPLKPSRRWLALLNQKYLFSNCDHLILVSKLIASFIYQKRGWILPKHSVILNAQDLPELLSETEKTTIRRQIGAEDRPLFIYSGSLYRWYGTLDLVKAFHLALQKRPDLKLIIVGSGDEENTIREYIQKKSLTDSVLLIGVVPHAESLKFIQAADYCLVFYPGEPTYFGSSSKVIEYMAAGKPVISTPQMIEIIEDGVTGFMSKTASPEDFAVKIEEAVSKPDLAQTVGENARNLISSHYTWNQYIEKLIKIYKATLNQT